MKKQGLKIYLERTRSLAFWGVIFWLLETIIFLFIYGWHWTATELPEEICDGVVSIILFIVVWRFIAMIVHLVESEIAYRDAMESITKTDKPDSHGEKETGAN